MGQRLLRLTKGEIKRKQRIFWQKKSAGQQLQKADKAEKDVGVKSHILFVQCEVLAYLLLCYNGTRWKQQKEKFQNLTGKAVAGGVMYGVDII